MPGVFRFTANVNETDENLSAVLEAFEELFTNQALVGIPEEDSVRLNDSVSNAQLLYIHSNGSSVNNIPARPVIEPAIEHEKEQIASLLQSAAEAAANGDRRSALAGLEKAATHGANLSQDWFTNQANGWPELKRETIKRKGSDRPLVDTDEMRKSITYKVDRI